MKKGEINWVIVPIILLVVALIFILATNTKIFAGTKEALPSMEEIREISDQVKVTEKELESREASKIADKFSNVFRKTEGNDCYVDLNFNEFDDDFIVEFRELSDGGYILDVYKERDDKISSANLRWNVFFSGVGVSQFKINEFKEFETDSRSFNVGELVLYKSSEGRFYFLKFDEILDIKGFRPECGSPLLITDFVGVDYLNDYLNLRLNYLGKDWEIYNLVNKLNELTSFESESHDLGTILGERIEILKRVGDVKAVLSPHLESHFGELYGTPDGCWEMKINEDASYGGLKEEGMIDSLARVTLSNGEVLDLDLNVGGESCLPLPENIFSKIEISEEDGDQIIIDYMKDNFDNIIGNPDVFSLLYDLSSDHVLGRSQSFDQERIQESLLLKKVFFLPSP